MGTGWEPRWTHWEHWNPKNHIISKGKKLGLLGVCYLISFVAKNLAHCHFWPRVMVGVIHKLNGIPRGNLFQSTLSYITPLLALYAKCWFLSWKKVLKILSLDFILKREREIHVCFGCIQASKYPMGPWLSRIIPIAWPMSSKASKDQCSHGKCFTNIVKVIQCNIACVSTRYISPSRSINTME